MKKTFTLLMLTLPVCINQLHSQMLTDSLHAHYLFNGNLLDETTNNYDLSVNMGTTSYTTFSGADQAVACDGSTRYSTTVGFDNSYFTATALSTWFKCSTVTGAHQTMLQGTSIGFGLHISSTGKVYGFFDGGSPGSLESTSILTDGNWHHILAQNNGTTTQLYIDGVLNGTMSESLYIVPFASSHVLNVGISVLNINPYTGELNDMRIYNRTLSAAEVAQVYINIPESIQEDMLSVSMYPNPSANNITVEINKPFHEASVEITDALGKIVSSTSNIQASKTQITLNQPTGLYMVTVNVDGRKKSIKLIKE